MNTSPPLRTRRTRRIALPVFFCTLCVLRGGELVARAQEPSAPQAVSPAQLKAAIDKLGDLDYATRTNASRTIRRTATAQAVPALLQAVAEHNDGYVRYRALVLLTGFNDPRDKEAMRESLTSPNDRLRAVAYSFFEHNPDRTMTQTFLAALDKERGEFVRPALVRALAALGPQPALVRDVSRGEDFFRSAVIEALGDYKATYAFDAITAVAKVEGPLQDDAAIALGKIGDKRALETLAALQRSAPRKTQPSIAAAICLLGVNCEVHQKLADVQPAADQRPPCILRRGCRSARRVATLRWSRRFDAFPREIRRASSRLRWPGAAQDPVMLPVLEADRLRPGAPSLVGELRHARRGSRQANAFFYRRSYWMHPRACRAARDCTIIGKLDF